MTTLVVGCLFVALAVAAFITALFADPNSRVPKRRRTMGRIEPEQPLTQTVVDAVAGAVDSAMKARGWAPFGAFELEMAEIRTAPAIFVSCIVVGAALGSMVGFLLGGPFLALVCAAAVPVGAKLWVRFRAGRRRKQFAKQLDNTLRIIAGALRAGHSLPTGLASVAADSEPPMGDEMSRVVTEVRLGRDLVEALRASAARMRSEDLEWFAGAVALQRDAGGNLNEIIDTVAETIRERAELREKVRANAAEGKMSAYVLMGLPVVLGLVYSIMHPGYMTPMFTTSIGLILTAGSLALYVVGVFWMRAIVNFKV